MSQVKSQNTKGEQLFAEHKKIYPKKNPGKFRIVKTFFMVNMFLVYYSLPFIRWDRGPDAPSQGVLFDIPNRRFYYFPVEIWPQEVYYFTGLLMVAALLLFLTTAVAGRIWCGWWCFQTVYTDLFVMIERVIEGNRNKRIKLDKSSWSMSKFFKKLLKHSIWLVISFWTIVTLMAYFTDVFVLLPGLWNDVKNAATLQFSQIEYVTSWTFIAILTFTTYMAAGIAREQVCIYMCPYPRIQAALIDEQALNVTYRYDRGEPRGSKKKKKKLEAQGVYMGDCIDCDQCVWACPTGTDIRLGNQLSCVNCGLCIDACNIVMKKVGLPTGLIKFDTDLNIERSQKGKANKTKIVRPRTVIYVVAIIISIGAMGYGLTNRSITGINVLHDRNPLYVEEGDGSVMNAFTVRMLNMERKTRRFSLRVSGPAGVTISKVSEGMYIFEKSANGDFIVDIGPDTTRELRVIVIQPAGSTKLKSEPLLFMAKDLDTGETLSRSDFFKGPGS
jgi:cytochrome c oxidase accessory protein FixG